MRLLRHTRAFRTVTIAAAITLALSGCARQKAEVQSYQPVTASSSATSDRALHDENPSEPAGTPRSVESIAAAPTADPCHPQAIAQDMNWSNGSIAFCDGTWAVGHDARFDDFPVGDVQSVLKRSGSTWKRFAGIPAAQGDCAAAQSEGAPSTVILSMGTCTIHSGSSNSGTNSNASTGAMSITTPSGRTVAASAPACDGRGVLIVQSVIDDGDHLGELGAALDATPGAEFTPPGQCASLRASVNGQRIFPVYVDYGHNISALCSAAYPGANPRILKDSADYSSPC